MEDKKVKAGCVAVGICLFVIAILLVLIVMFFYNTTMEKNNLQAQMDELETTVEGQSGNVNENEDKNEMVSFSKLMDMIYPKKFNDNTKEYSPNMVKEVITTGITEVYNNNNIEMQMSGVYAYQEEKSIDVTIMDTINNTNKHYVVSGVNEEVVSIVVIPFEGEATPNYIYFLTRDGDVYYLYNNNTVDMTNLNAIKIEDINNVISITSASVIDENAMHAYAEVVASTYEGDYKVLTDYINN